MRTTLIIAAICGAGLLSSHLASCGPTPAEQEKERAASAELAAKSEERRVRQQEANEKRKERREAAALLIEEALAKLEADGVERSDVTDYFTDEIEEEVCDRRTCSDE